MIPLSEAKKDKKLFNQMVAKQNEILAEHKAREPQYQLQLNARDTEMLHLMIDMATALLNFGVHRASADMQNFINLFQTDEHERLVKRVSALHTSAMPEILQMGEQMDMLVYAAHGVDATDGVMQS